MLPRRRQRDGMADLEEHAFKRDRRFVVRLLLTLACGLVFGVFVYAQLTSQRTAGCAADAAMGTEAKPP
jgi:hypothetical protein